jgi:F420-dependent methylenetetrahydromethanopterin dehydrogenase
MALFNSNVIKVLAITGVYRIIYQEIDRVIIVIKKGLKLNCLSLIIDTDDSLGNEF